MKVHTTNYYNTLIEIAEDSPVQAGTLPPAKGEQKTVAGLQFEMLFEHPYEFTSDEVLYTVFAQRKAVPQTEWAEQRQAFFSKGQPCFRASPLTKTYGWGVHSNGEGKIAIYGAESDEYRRLVEDDSVKKVRAMRSKQN